MSYSISYYELPNNVVNGAMIPLSTIGIPLAVLTISSEANGLVLLRGSVGWNTLANRSGSNEVSVLFKIWRGAPDTGTLIYSIRDSSESWADKNKVTQFSHVDHGFTETKDVTYTFTAELPSGGSVNVVGPMTFTVFDMGV